MKANVDTSLSIAHRTDSQLSLFRGHVVDVDILDTSEQLRVDKEPERLAASRKGEI